MLLKNAKTFFSLIFFFCGVAITLLWVRFTTLYCEVYIQCHTPVCTKPVNSMLQHQYFAFAYDFLTSASASHLGFVHYW